MYALIQNGQVARYPYSATDLRLDNRQTSWPSGQLPDDLLASFGVLPVHGQPPAHDTSAQTVDELAPVFNAATNRWERRWSVRAYNQQERDQKAVQVRELRNQRLSETDWTQLSDTPGQTRAAYVQYRQDLRNVPQQAGFPFSVIWPTPPAV